ncbi:purine-cytosine permease family protein [Rubrobacter xylanophilus]|uniref:purine-cytosine permease family protein n=1 Tax=Rubrobacter xylanophilus TaxID=49319 RepID=UPI00117B4FE2|nr:cytosine permease [Rubrobacter xylanophilus]
MLQRVISKLGHDSVEQEAGAERTMGFGRTVMLWLAANMVVTTLLTGTLFVPGVPYMGALAVILAGTLVGVLVLALVGCMGTRTGLPTMVLTRGAFGVRGGKLPGVLNLVVLMGWSWVQALLAGIAVDYAVASFTGFSNVVLFTVLCQSVVVLLALFGHRGIERVEPLMAAVMLLLAAYVFYRAFSSYGFARFAAIPGDPQTGMTLAIAFDVVVATAISWTVLAADFNRNARSQLGGIFGTVVGYTASTSISMSLGVTAAAYALLSGGERQGFDPRVLVENFGLPAAVVVFLSVMATNTLVVYGMTMSYLDLRPRASFPRTALIIGVISILGATWQGILDRFLDFLLLIGTFFVPVFAIMLADYFVFKRGSYDPEAMLDKQRGAYWYTGGYSVAAWAAYAAGAALVFYWTQISPPPFGATVPGFVATFVLYSAVRLAANRLGGGSEK